MDHWTEKPLLLSEKLDLTFHLMKKHFSILFMIMLILLGPLYLIQGLSMLTGGVPMIRGESEGPWIESWLESMSNETYLSKAPDAQMIFYTLTSIVMFIISMPMAEAAVILAIDRIRNGETPKPISMIKLAFSRFWPLLGGTAVYFLIVSGAFLGISFLFVSSGIFAFSLQGGDSILSIIGFGAVGLACLFTALYLMIRWGFYFPAIIFEKVSPGLTKSWRLTRNNFWRLFSLMIVVSILTSIITAGFQALFYLVFGTSVLGLMLTNLVEILTTLLFFIAYAIAYFDLRLRNEASDIRTMVAHYHRPNSSMVTNPDTDNTDHLIGS